MLDHSGYSKSRTSLIDNGEYSVDFPVRIDALCVFFRVVRMAQQEFLAATFVCTSSSWLASWKSRLSAFQKAGPCIALAWCRYWRTCSCRPLRVVGFWVHQLASAPVRPIAFVPRAPTHRSCTISTLAFVPDYTLFGDAFAARSPADLFFTHLVPIIRSFYTYEGFINLIFLL